MSPRRLFASALLACFALCAPRPVLAQTSSSASATFLQTDIVTQGNWPGTHGQDGFVLANNASTLPSYATLGVSGASTWTWASPTTDPRAPFTSATASTRIASTYYSATNFTFDLNLAGGSHQVALYLLDFDTTSRAETISILDPNNQNAVLDTRAFSGFHNGEYAIWNLQGHVLIQVTATGGENAVVSGLFFQTPATAAPPTVSITSPSAGTVAGSVNLVASVQSSIRIESVQFLLDGKALGAPVTTGTSGTYSFAWATATASNGPHTLSATATDDQAQSTTSAGVSVTVANTVTAPAATYLQPDTTTQGNWPGTYGQDGYVIANGASNLPSYATLNISGANTWTWASPSNDPRALFTSAASTTRIASTYYSGTNFTFDLNLSSGAHQVALYLLDFDSTTRAETISILNASNNAVLDSRSFAGFNGGLWARWTLQGHVLIQITNTAGENAAVSGLFFQTLTAAAPPTVSITSPTSGTVSGSITVTAKAQSTIAIQSVQFLLDGNNLGSPVTTGSAGTYSLPWATAGTTNGVHKLSAIATDAQGQSTTSSAVSVTVSNATTVGNAATYVRTDTTTQGEWKTQYGVDGSIIANDSSHVPYYATLGLGSAAQWTWAASTTDVRALTKYTSATDRIASAFYAPNAFTYDLNLIDSKQHQVALYFLDWDGGRVAVVNVLDAATNQVLDKRILSNFTNGQYLVWNLQGHVLISIQVQSGDTAVVSGVFFGGSGITTPPPTVSITAPAANASLANTATLTASASSTVGIAAVQFVLDGTTMLGSPITASPYTYQWNTLSVSNGTHTLTAVATDSTSQQTTSAPITVKVANGTLASASAVFIAKDTATEGNWKGVYGNTGEVIANDSNNPPSYAALTLSGAQAWTWVGSSTDPRALQQDAGSSRIASTFYAASNFSLDVNITDSNSHQLALYFLDWDSTSRAETVSIYDGNTNALLDTESISSFQNGAYLVWTVKGHIMIQFKQTAGINAVLSGIFLGGGSGGTSQPPIANAGANQNVALGSLVTLNGSASSDPAGRALTYLWSFSSLPAGSKATLSNATAVSPTFTPDKPGTYVLSLTVNNGTLNSTPATVSIAAQAAAPVAKAGPTQKVSVGAVVTLDGSASSDPAGLPLTYLWSFVTVPSGSAATLTNPTSIHPTFTADKNGSYTAQLIVNNGYVNSAPASVVVSTQAVAPTANAGAAQTVPFGAKVTLNGSASTDLNGLPLTYNWTLTSLPTGSLATLTNPNSVNPTFVADVYGSYTAQLIVSDSLLSSAPSTVIISTSDVAPVANAGSNQTLNIGTTVHLTGAGSTSVTGLPLTYSWSLTTLPTGSTATLTNPTSVTPTFVADAVGTYVAQLIVNDGVLSSTAATVTIASKDLPPTANAGPNQSNVTRNTLIQLDGSGSTDVDGHALTYTWTILTAPQGSKAALSSTSVVRPTFTPDLAGTYVIQVIVNDGFLNSTPATVTITTTEGYPVANAGSNQVVSLGSKVTLNGSGSTDPNGYPLTYTWTFTTVPTGSAAVLTNANTAQPTFTVDKAGTYVAQLIVSDPLLTSKPVTVTISTSALAPVANPGPAQTVRIATLVTLNGSGSTDSSGHPLTYSWSLLSKPAGSAATLANSNTVSPTITPDVAGDYQIQLIVNDTVQNSQPVTVVVTAVLNSITITFTNAVSSTYQVGSGNVHLAIPAGSGSGACTGQLVSISLDNTAVAVLSTATANPATSVCIPAGSQDAPFTITTNGTVGSATITAFATQFQSGTLGVSVGARQATLSLPSPTVGQGRALTGTITLASPAPSSATNASFPNGVTFNLSSNLPLLATVSGSVTIPAGSTTGTFTLNGLSPGTASISAAAVTGFSSSSIPVTVVSPAQSITIPQNLSVGPGQSLPFPVSIGAAATNAVTITFATSGTGSATISPSSVVIPVGATTPATQPQITGNTIGPVTVTASAPNYGPDIETVTVSTTLSLSPTTLTVLTSNTVNYTLSASNVAPTGGFTVNLSIADPTKATVPATVTIPAGQSSTTVTVTGVAPGNTTLTAGGPGYVAATAAVVVAPAPGTTINSNYCCTLGYNEQYTLSGSIALAAPAGNLAMTIGSSDTTKFLLSTSAAGPFTQSISVSIAAGSTSIPTFYIQGLASSGTANVTTHATGYGDASTQITMVPTGFYVSGGTSTTTFSSTSNVIVSFTELNPTTLATQYTGNGYSATLRTGAAAVTVNLTDSSTATGTLSGNPVTVSAGQGSSTATFQPVASGKSNISIAAMPTGYSTPSNNQSTTFTVTAPNLEFQTLQTGCWNGTSPSVSCQIGKDEQYGAFSPILDTAAPVGGRTVTITSSDPTKLLLTTNAGATGTASVTVNIAAGASGGALVYAQGLTSSGTVTVTETAAGYNTATATFTLVPTGVYVSGGTNTTTFSTASTVNVYFTELNPTTLAVQYTGAGYNATLRTGAAAIAVQLNDSSANVGTIGLNSLTISAGQTGNSTVFQPAAKGTAAVSVASTPPGYSTPSNNQSTTFTVTAPNLEFQTLQTGCWNGTSPSVSCQIGKDEQYGAFAPILDAPAPAGGRTVTVTSSDSTKLLLTTNPGTIGTASVTVNVAAGASGAALVYAQGLTSSGTVTVTETAAGYNTATATFTLVPTGVYISGGTTTTTFSSPSTINVYFTELNPTTQAVQYTGAGYNATLRTGAAAITAQLKDSSTTVGTIGGNSVVISAGQSSNSTTFQPATAGTATVRVASTPPGYVTPSNNQSTTFTVTAPNLEFQTLQTGCWNGTSPSVSCQIGKDEQYGAFYPILDAPAPTGGRTLTITSSDPTKLLLTTNPGTVGNASVTVNVAAGASQGALVYAQGMTSSGTVTVTETAAGYNTATSTFTLVPTGVAVSGSTSTTTFSSASTINVNFTELNPTTLNVQYTGAGYNAALRTGASAIAVQLTNGNPAVGTLGSSSVTIGAGQSSNTTTFQPSSAGVDTISIAATPSGYSTSSNSQSITFTVSAPNLEFQTLQTGCWNGTSPSVSCQIGKDEQYGAFYPILDAAAPAGGRTVTVTSTDPSKLLLTTDASAVGTASVSVNVAAGASQGPLIYAQGLASTGTVKITETAAGYNPATSTFTLVPTGVSIGGGTSTTTFSAASTVNVNFTELNPTTLNTQTTGAGYNAILRTGALPVTVNLNCPNCSAPSVPTGPSIPVTSYSMPNGATGSYVYQDVTYSNCPASDCTTTGAPLSGGTGRLTNGVVPTTEWTVNSNAAGWIGWSNAQTGGTNPTITFNFAGSVTVNSVSFVYDNSLGGGGVSEPASVSINGTNYPLAANTVEGIQTVTIPGLNLVGSSVNVQFFQGSTNWIMIGQVSFYSAAPTAVTTYAMPNGGTGTWVYQDVTYSNCPASDCTTTGAALSGGTGRLTNGVIPTTDYDFNANSAGWIGWTTAQTGGTNPTITFNFAGSVTVNTVSFVYDNALNSGDISAPASVSINGTNYPIVASTVQGPQTVTISGLNLVGSSISMQFFQASRPFIMLGQVSFYGAPTVSTSTVTVPAASRNATAKSLSTSAATTNSTVGILATSTLTITPGQSSASTTFQPTAVGTADISIAATPTGYTTPGNGQDTTFTITQPAVSLSSTTVGQNLETTANVQLAIAAPSATNVTLTSADSTKILLSNSATTPGSGTLTIPLAAGASQTPTFYVQSLGGAGTSVNISISVPGYSAATGSVTINPAGFVFSGPSSFDASVSGNPTTLTVIPSMLDPVYLTPTTTQLVRPGLTGTDATITLTDQSGTSPIGSITTNPVVFNGADNPNSQTTSFVAKNPGVTLLKITSPTGFTNASSTVAATVTP